MCSGEANKWRIRQRVVLDLFSNLQKWVRSKGSFGEPLKHLIAQRGQILVCRTDDDPPAPRVSIQNVPVCTFKRPHVYRHHAHMCFDTEASWMYTRGFFFNVSHTHTTTPPRPQHTETETQRERRDDGRGETRQKTREEKTRRKRREDTERERGEDEFDFFFAHFDCF